MWCKNSGNIPNTVWLIVRNEWWFGDFRFMIFLISQSGGQICHNITTYIKSGITFIRNALVHVISYEEIH